MRGLEREKEKLQWVVQENAALREKLVYLVASMRLAAVEETLAQKEDVFLQESLMQENTALRELLCL